MKISLGAGCLCLLILLSVINPALSADDDVLAKIGEKNITFQDLERIISYYPEDKQKAIQEHPQYKTVLLRRIVQGMVISDLARKDGLDRDPAIKEQIEQYINDFLTVEYIKRSVVKGIKVTEQDIEQYYKSHINEFKSPEMVRARHILIKLPENVSETDKKRYYEKADEILKRVKAGEDFEKLASEFSEDRGSKKKGGDLGYFGRGRMVKPFEDAAFSLKPGEVSGIVETKFGYHIIKVEDLKAEAVQPIGQVKETIEKKLLEDFRQAKIKEFMDSAMMGAGVEIYPEKLELQQKK